MSNEPSESSSQQTLRSRALARLSVPGDAQDTRVNSAAALGVLHDLASSPATAAASLKLLHELQVHQVELELQDEELRRSIAELEAALFRQVQLHDHAPATCFTVDRGCVLREANRAAGRLLGLEREALSGRALDQFLEPASGRAFRAVLARVAEGARDDGCVLRFIEHAGRSRVAYAAVNLDPAGTGFLVACVEVREPATDFTGVAEDP